MTGPSFSIITPCLNRVAFIRDAVESVLTQGYPNVEHIVVDGGSTDGTLGVLRRYSHLCLMSEPDQGVYDALNKGLSLAQGEVIGWLNSDDIFLPEAFDRVAETFRSHPEASAVSGGVDYALYKGDRERVYEHFPAVMDDRHYWNRIVDTPATNGWFIRPSVFEQVGQYDTRYRVVADREFLIRVALAGIRPYPVSDTLCRYRQHRGSLTISGEDSRQPGRGEQRIQVLGEDLDMLSGFLNKKDLPKPARQALVVSHSVRAYRLTLTALYHRQFRLAAQSTKRAWRVDPFWPLIFLRMSFQRVAREYSR